MPSLNTGNAILSNAIAVNSSYNVGIGGSASGSFKLQVTGTTNLTGALTGTSAVFSSQSYVNTGGTDNQLGLVGTAPSLRLTNAVTGASINGFVAMSGANNNYIQGSVSGDMCIGNQNNGKILFGFGSGTATLKMTLDSTGAATFSNNVAINGASLDINPSSGNSNITLRTANVFEGYIQAITGGGILFGTGSSATERMRLTSSGLTINSGGLGFLTLGASANYGSITSGGSGATIYMNGATRGGTGGATSSAVTIATDAQFQVTDSSTNNAKFYVTPNGNINLNDVVYNNTAVATTRILYIGSDYRIGGISSIRESKKNIQNVSNVDWIYSLNPVTFNYRKKDEQEQYTDEIYDELVYGLIAEDTQPIADFLINYNDKKEMIGIEYMRLITPMLKAIQEQQAQIEEQQKQINSLINR